MQFLKKYRSVILAAIMVVISLVMLSYNLAHPVAETGLIRRAVLELTEAIERTVDVPVQTLNNTWKRYLFLVGLERENGRLLRQNALLTQQLIRHQEGYLEGLRLKALLDLKEQVPYEMVAASVTGRNRQAIRRTILINKGSSQGIKVGMPVVAARGVVGRIIETSRDASRILLLIDESSNVDSIVQGSRSHGILQGSDQGHCVLKYIPKMEGVRIGDAVISSGLCGVFPKSWLLGTVTRVARGENGLFQKVEVNPSVDFLKLEEVLVLTSLKGPNE